MAPIEPGRMDTRRVEAAVAEILAAIGEDPLRPGLTSTPSRVAESYKDFFGGIGVDPQQFLTEVKELDVAEDELGELVLRSYRDAQLHLEHALGQSTRSFTQALRRPDVR